MLQYHRHTLALLANSVLPAITPNVAPRAVAELASVEQRIGRRLPASVAEWYSLDQACHILLRFSNGDPPVELGDLGSADGDESGDIADRLTIQHENQGVCVWAIELDDTDDPPVSVAVEDRPWMRCADTFSTFIYTRVWDYGLAMRPVFALQAQNGVLSEDALTNLRRQFSEGPRTWGWPGHSQFRFYNGDRRILIWASDEQADWWLSAHSEQSLESLAKSVWDCDDLGSRLWSHTAEGERLLKHMRA